MIIMNKTTMNINGNTLLTILSKYTYSEHGYTNANNMLHTPSCAGDVLSYIKEGTIKSYFSKTVNGTEIPCNDSLEDFFSGELRIHCFRRRQHVENERREKSGQFACIWCYQWSIKITNKKKSLVLSDVFDHNIVKEILDNKLNK